MNANAPTFANAPLAAAAQDVAHAARANAHTAPVPVEAFARTASTITTADGVQLYYKDWGPKNGPVVTFSHGWPLSSDSWESQMIFLASKGFRVVAHDRRGHGRSSQPWEGNDMDHYADDLAAVIDALDLKDVTLVGFLSSPV
jgi:non-heme chloroperoxidase